MKRRNSKVSEINRNTLCGKLSWKTLFPKSSFMILGLLTIHDQSYPQNWFPIAFNPSGFWRMDSFSKWLNLSNLLPMPKKHTELFSSINEECCSTPNTPLWGHSIIYYFYRNTPPPRLIHSFSSFRPALLLFLPQIEGIHDATMMPLGILCRCTSTWDSEYLCY